MAAMTVNTTINSEIPNAYRTLGTTETDQGSMKRSLSLVSGCAFIVGTMIGSGIFASPGSVLVHAHSAGMALIAWVVAGTYLLVLSVWLREMLKVWNRVI